MPAEAIERVLGYWGVSAAGNFEGRNILHVPMRARAEPPPGLDQARRALLARREQRVRPGLDDKRLCSWNALMISALADAGAALGREDFLDAARGCARFIHESMRDDSGRLLRTWKDGEGRFNAYLEDHAFLVEAMLRLYEATLEVRWFDAARETADAMIERFADEERGGFFTTSHDHEQLIARRKDLGDHPIPSGNSSAALGLLRLAALTGERSYEDHAVARPPPVRAAGGPAPRRLRPPASRRSTSTSPPSARWRWSRRRTAPTPLPHSPSSPRSCARPTAPTSSSPAGRRAATDPS